MAGNERATYEATSVPVGAPPGCWTVSVQLCTGATARHVALGRGRGNAPETTTHSPRSSSLATPRCIAHAARKTRHARCTEKERVHTTRPLWDTLTDRPALPRDPPPHLHVDVAIVGGGITGLTSAALLTAAGSSVALLEAREIGSGVTSRSTGHLTQILDVRYADIERRLGAERTRLVALSSAQAIEQIAEIVERFGIDCGFERVPGYLYTEHEEHVDNLEHELEVARRAGLSVRRDDVPLPFVTRAGLRVEGQAQLDPLAYVAGLAVNAAARGCHVFERSHVIAIDEGEPCRVHLERGGVVTASRIILATHVPLNRVLLTPRVAQYRSYVLSGPASSTVPGLFWDTEDPYHYLRRHRVGDDYHWLVGGADQ
jgi:glycine/D-amino acid oxidase-like deaminating enzyme